MLCPHCEASISDKGPLAREFRCEVCAAQLERSHSKALRALATVELFAMAILFFASSKLVLPIAGLFIILGGVVYILVLLKTPLRVKGR